MAGLKDDLPTIRKFIKTTPNRLPQTSLYTIADNRSSQSSSHGQTHAARAFILGLAENGREVSVRPAIAFAVNAVEFPSLQETAGFREAVAAGCNRPRQSYLSELTVSTCRPFARRAERMRRPPGVFIRVRKPCFFARRRLFG